MKAKIGIYTLLYTITMVIYISTTVKRLYFAWYLISQRVQIRENKSLVKIDNPNILINNFVLISKVLISGIGNSHKKNGPAKLNAFTVPHC